jgi:hypothetical protein
MNAESQDHDHSTYNENKRWAAAKPHTDWQTLSALLRPTGDW